MSKENVKTENMEKENKKKENRKKGNKYFDYFIQMSDFSVKAAELLQENTRNFQPDRLGVQIEKMHAIEHGADQPRHQLTHELIREFLPPIDREDIVDLANHIDDVTDAVEDVLLRLYMLNIRRMLPDAVTFTEIVLRCCQAVKAALEEFPNFKKSATIRDLVIAIDGIEEEGDRLYTKAVRALYEAGGDALEVSAWRETFQRLERCCDCAEDVAKTIETIILKNG